MTRVSPKSHPPRDPRHLTRPALPPPSHPLYHNVHNRRRTIKSSPFIIQRKNLIGDKSITKKSSPARSTSPHAPHSSSPVPPSLSLCSSSSENHKILTLHRPTLKSHRCREYHKKVIPRDIHITSRAPQFLPRPTHSITTFIIVREP